MAKNEFIRRCGFILGLSRFTEVLGDLQVSRSVVGCHLERASWWWSPNVVCRLVLWKGRGGATLVAKVNNSEVADLVLGGVFLASEVAASA